MCCYLVDYENIMPRKAAELQGFVRGDTVIVFYSDKTPTISANFINELRQRNADVKFLLANCGHKNDLDFQLSSYVGYAAATGHRTIKIVSNDHGYDVVCRFWTGLGYCVNRQGNENCQKLTKGQKKADNMSFSAVIKNGQAEEIKGNKSCKAKKKAKNEAKEMHSRIDSLKKKLPAQTVRKLSCYGNVDTLLEKCIRCKNSSELNGLLMGLTKSGKVTSAMHKVLKKALFK